MRLRAFFWFLSILFTILTTLLFTIWYDDSILVGVGITIGIIFAAGLGLCNILTED